MVLPDYRGGGRETGGLPLNSWNIKVPALELGCDLLKCSNPSMENMIGSLMLLFLAADIQWILSVMFCGAESLDY